MRQIKKINSLKNIVLKNVILIFCFKLNIKYYNVIGTFPNVRESLGTPENIRERMGTPGNVRESRERS